MRLLLDTHILIAIVERQTSEFPKSIRDAVAEPVNELIVSVVSLWEIAIKWHLGKLHIGPPPEKLPEVLADSGIGLLKINEHHVLALVAPEPPTRDPFDRLLLAQCQVEDLRLVTIDRALVGHPMADLSVR